jgi:hypothetical protein
MHDFLSTLAAFPGALAQPLRPHLHQVALALSVTLLATFGNDINGRVKSAVRKYSFPIRLSVFVALVAFGYGLASLLVASVLGRMLVSVDNRYLAGVVVISFIAVGMIAEHKGHI